MRRFHLVRSILIAALVFAACLSTTAAARAQAPSGWHTPQWIPGLVDSDPAQYPVFITDPGGKIHVFHSQWVGDRFGIVYSTWTVGVGWTKPVDIIVSNSGQSRVVGAFLDDTGGVNVLFWGGDDQGADIYLFRAPLQDAQRSTAWSSPVVIGPDAIAPTTAAVVSDQNGRVVVVYSGNETGNGLYSVVSEDYGSTWTESREMFSASSDQLWPSGLQTILTRDGSIHAVWALSDLTGNSRRVYHASLDANAAAWGSPQPLAESIGYGANTPAIVEHDGSLMVIYHNDFPTTRFMIRSFDGGSTWSAPTRLFEQVGSNGAAALVTDSADGLHMFFGNRVGTPAIHGLWHSVWMNDGWSAPEAVVSGPQVLVGPNNEEGFDPSYAQAVISQGNLLLVVWRHDPMAGPLHVWYSYRYLNTPAIPTQAVELPAATGTPVPTATPAGSPTPAAEKFDGDSPESAPVEINTLLAVSLVPVLILIIAVLVRRRNTS